ncbi:MAG TPA: hypothetical protein VIY53_19680, partial [Acidobacteriaceae bacterium]
AYPGTATRGNVTQMLKWSNPAGGSNPLPRCGQATSSSPLVSIYYFDGAGQLQKCVDPGTRDHLYMGEIVGEPSITTDGFLFRVTDALTDHDNHTGNWANGTMASHSDPLGLSRGKNWMKEQGAKPGAEPQSLAELEAVM